MARCLAVALFFLLTLTSCGGGGGGDDGGGGGDDASFHISFDRSSLSFDFAEGAPPPTQVVVATGSGDPGETVYLGVFIEGQGVAESGISITFSGDRANIAVTPRHDLAAATYNGRIIMQACADPQCTRHFSGSPFAVAYSIVVRQGLRVSPTALNLQTDSGIATAARIDVTVPDGATDFTAQVFSGTEWLGIQSKDATGFSVATRTLPGGNYTGSVRVASGQAERVIPVSLTVLGRPGGDRDLQVNMSSLTFSAAATGTSPPQNITVAPPTWSTEVSASVSYTSGSNWLAVVPNGDGTWRVTASASSLAQGSYSAAIAFRSAWPSTPRSVFVSLTVGPGLVLPVTQPVVADAEATAATLTGGTPVTVAGGIPFNWTASTASAWLRVDTPSGSGGGELRWHVDTTALASLGNFADHDATINVTTNLANAPTGTLAVRLTKRLPELHTVAPYYVVRGRAARVLMRGRGFDGLVDTAARVSIAGLTPASITRVNDTQLIVELPASSAESHEARVTNALGMNTGSAVLKTLAPQTYTAAAVDQSGFAVSLIYDAERRALLLVNRNGGSNSLKRIAFNGSTWTSTPLIAADLWDVGLSQDGTTLLAAMTAGELRLLDPVTSVERSRIALGGAMSEDREWFLSQGLSVTSDAQVLLPLDASPGSPFKNLERVDLRTGTVNYVNQASGYFIFYRGPLFGGPRDGSRFMGRQNSGLSSVEDIYYAVKYDAANGALSTTSKILSPFDLRFTDDGRLALISLDRVVDANDDLHGLVRLPAADQADWLTVAGQIAPDGGRVYLLAYPKRGNADSSASGIKPRVYVLDSATASADPAGLPVLGYFEIDQYPSGCVSENYPFSCWGGLASTISADGNTLFFSGSLRTLVVPIAGALNQPQATVRRAATWRFGAQR